jgi:hypothetical protein
LCQTDQKRAAFHAWFLEESDNDYELFVDGKGRTVIATSTISADLGTSIDARPGEYIGIVYAIPPEDHGFPYRLAG